MPGSAVHTSARSGRLERSNRQFAIDVAQVRLLQQRAIDHFGLFVK